MIEVKRLNGSLFYINADQIMTVEETPDTVITLSNGEKWIVADRAADIASRFEAYKQRCQGLSVITRTDRTDSPD